ncbi:SART-1 family protein, putative [Babesia bigemina]|uniref:SART-1 family protein, putative n=1 Tax=Babesia bigemina TaxID=5866 RepID=A0A061D8C0_BABBI|nr:SART-1 family protein, putative [Babesia bigemina]CDR96768.1 SART-1 family protein, putative [Babesia bigemina]|eukprot:XP_012768954.1 SART-1 family protein, putative [Babesia bigemina]
MELPGGDGALSCSIEETNAIRLKLGLKPLAVRDSTPAAEGSAAKAPETKAVDNDEIDESVAARKRLIEGGGIADLLAKSDDLAPPGVDGEAGAVDGAYSSLDVEAWSRRMAAIHRRKRMGTLNYSDDEEEEPVAPAAPPKRTASAVKSGAKLKVLHKVDELPLDSGKEVVLTLADVGVLEAESAGVAEVNFLENPELAKRGGVNLKGGSRGAGGETAEYNPYEEEEDADGKTDILRKYDRAVEEYQGSTLSNLAGGKRGFYVDLDSGVEPAPKKAATMLTQPTEESFDFGGLQRKKDLLKNRHRPVNWDKVFSSGSTNARSSAQADSPAAADEVAPSQIVKRVTLDMDDVEECDHLYAQLSKHRNRILSTVKTEEPGQVAETAVRTSVIDTGAVVADAPGLQINATSELIKAVKPRQYEEEITVQRASQRGSKASGAEAADDDADDTVEYPDGSVDNSAPMTSGIAAALAYLKEKGDIIEDKKDLSEVGKDITLHYLDEYGRRLSPKEAFRQISWSFHGKKPGLNKQERKIKRIERGEFCAFVIYSVSERMSKLNPLEGLPTMKALLTHQAESKSSHLVLSGNTPGM